jgi:hypothetical protein
MLAADRLPILSQRSIGGRVRMFGLLIAEALLFARSECREPFQLT